VYKKTGIETYTHAAENMKGYLKARQNMMEPRFGGLGAVWGSWPISGEYGRYEALNWAVKYMADVLLVSIEGNGKN